MYAGQVVETASVGELFVAPKHPYSAALLRSRPRLRDARAELPSIPGIVPPPAAMPEGCRFAGRCELATDECTSGPIRMEELTADHTVRCLRHDSVPAPAAGTDQHARHVEVMSP